MSYCINPNCQHPENPDNNIFCAACGSELLIQGHYRVIKSLGKGGFAITYEITGQNKNQVLKVLTNNTDKAVTLFQREAKILEQIDHPGIPKVPPKGYFLYYPKGSKQPLHCLIMEKIEGVNLKQYIQGRDNRPIDDEIALQWLRELVGILDVIHSKELLHRDIKPSNIMMKPDGKLALIDFGAAKDLETNADGTVTATSTNATETATKTSIFSLAYTPQEQIVGQPLKQSDFFALGRTFIYLLTGREPNDKVMYNAMEDKIEWVKFINGDLPDNLVKIVDQMNERVANNRPKNTQEILQFISQVNVVKQPKSTPIKVQSNVNQISGNRNNQQQNNDDPDKVLISVFFVIIIVVGFIILLILMQSY
jgi:eukaryotic-like serine/threonine-protein kinase